MHLFNFLISFCQYWSTLITMQLLDEDLMQKSARVIFFEPVFGITDMFIKWACTFKTYNRNNSVPTTCQQDVFALLCTQLVEKLSATCWQLPTTHAKISHLVASLPTSRQQVVFALLVPICQQVWNKLLTTCNNLVDIIGLVARLFKQIRYSLRLSPIQSWYNSIVTTLCRQPCNILVISAWLYIRLVRTLNFVTSLIIPLMKLVTSC